MIPVFRIVGGDRGCRCHRPLHADARRCATSESELGRHALERWTREAEGSTADLSTVARQTTQITNKPPRFLFEAAFPTWLPRAESQAATCPAIAFFTSHRGHGIGPAGHLPDAFPGLPDAFPPLADMPSRALADTGGHRLARARAWTVDEAPRPHSVSPRHLPGMPLSAVGIEGAVREVVSHQEPLRARRRPR